MERYLLPKRLAGEILAHAREGWPEEVCGLIAGEAGAGRELHRGRNVSPTPRTAFDLDPDTLSLQVEFEAQGLKLSAIYHSHPDGPDWPSATDVAQASYPEAVLIICSLASGRPTISAFRIVDGQVREVNLQPPPAESGKDAAAPAPGGI